MADAKVVPYSLRDAPALIERLFPAQKISAEALEEHNAHAGQRLTALGSYWKGRKRLVVVRACVLGALLPATEDAEEDLAVFEALMAIDDAAFERRVKKRSQWPGILSRPYNERLSGCLRPEELQDQAYGHIWERVNKHLGTRAHTLVELVEQLGIMRFGHTPKVSDVFSGGGSIPFEAARLGCEVYASDLNPIACMLTWGALNLIGADLDLQARVASAREAVTAAVERRLAELRVEHDERGHRAKAYLYCLEVVCPQTGWRVPLSPSWVISRVRRTIAELRPDHDGKRFIITVRSGVTDAELVAAANGTVRGENLVYSLDGEEYSTPIRTIRGDYRDPDGRPRNRLRPWEVSDIAPRADDILQERLYCIQWMTRDTLLRGRPETFFAAPTQADNQREEQVLRVVSQNLLEWQRLGYVPDMPVEPGKETERLQRERGWTYWHHLFNPRQLLLAALVAQEINALDDETVRGCLSFDRTFIADKSARLCHWRTGAPGREGRAPSADGVENVFYNQALNPFFNFGARAFYMLRPSDSVTYRHTALARHGVVNSHPADQVNAESDVCITDPPYGDAVVYDEITEFFIAWLRRNPPAPFAEWIWDSRRALAVRGEEAAFRESMVAAYSAMSSHMPDNGIHIVMFTHKSGQVWGEMAQIFWGSGLRVMAAWYVATEVDSGTKKGGYVKGTVLLILRKRLSDESGYKNEIVQEVKAEVASQIDTMVGLNQSLRGHGRIENLFEDADLQMAGYAAALRVLTGYAKIDGRDMTREALRPRQRGEKGLVGEIIDFAVQVANEHMVPEGMDARVWERLAGAERFYLKMLDIEMTGAKKLDNYQNFAKAFRVGDYSSLMSSLKPNDARLKSAAQLKRAEFGESEFGRSATRAVLFALYELQGEVDGDKVLSHLRDLVNAYDTHRDDLAAIAAYVAKKRDAVDPDEAKAARILHGLIRNERIGA